MAFDLRRESLKSLFLITRLAIAFLNLFMTGALGQQIEASDLGSSHSDIKVNEEKTVEKEHHGEEEKEDEQKIPHVDPSLIYLYSKILILVVISGAIAAILVVAISRADFWIGS